MLEPEEIIENFNQEQELNQYPDPKSAKQLMETKFPDTLWLINSIFTLNTINQISAAPNQWKSWLTQYFAYKIAKGEKVFNHFESSVGP